MAEEKKRGPVYQFLHDHSQVLQAIAALIVILSLVGTGLSLAYTTVSPFVGVIKSILSAMWSIGLVLWMFVTWVRHWERANDPHAISAKTIFPFFAFTAVFVMTLGSITGMMGDIDRLKQTGPEHWWTHVRTLGTLSVTMFVAGYAGLWLSRTYWDMHVKVSILCAHLEKVSHRSFEEMRMEFLKGDQFTPPLTSTRFLRLVSPDDWTKLTGKKP